MVDIRPFTVKGMPQATDSLMMISSQITHSSGATASSAQLEIGALSGSVQVGWRPLIAIKLPTQGVRRRGTARGVATRQCRGGGLIYEGLMEWGTALGLSAGSDF